MTLSILEHYIHPFVTQNRLTLFSVTATSLIISIAYILKRTFETKHEIQGIPYPLRLPLIGNLWCLGPNAHESFAHLAEKLGGRYKVRFLLI